MQTLLTLPVSRTKVYFEKWLAVLVVIGIVLLCLVGALYAGLAIIHKDADGWRVFESVANLWLACSAMGTVGFSVAMLTGKKALSIAIVSGYALFCIILSSLTPAVEGLKDVDKLSLLHYYNNPQIMQNGLDGMHILVLGGALVVLTVLGWAGFTRRSINT